MVIKMNNCDQRVQNRLGVFPGWPAVEIQVGMLYALIQNNLGTDQGTLAGSTGLITGRAVALFGGPERRLRPGQR